MPRSKSPALAFPPGDFIREELEARGWTQRDLAEIIGRPVQAISAIINGRRSVTPETAVALGASVWNFPGLLAQPRVSPIVSTKPVLPTPVLKSARGSGARPERLNGETIGFSADDALLRLMPAVSTQRIGHGFDRPGGVAFEAVVDEHIGRLAGFPGALGDAPDRLTRRQGLAPGRGRMARTP